MWPHFFKCGSSTLAFTLMRLGRSLQCGRTFSSAEVEHIARTRYDSEGLQCGRTFSSAEVTRLDDYRSAVIHASMWPHFFKCGSAKATVRVSISYYELQCGRTFSSAEVLYFLVRYVRVYEASMWPHFFKCGSKPDGQRSKRGQVRFNVAALFQVRKSSK